jgi:hypothetical protein
VRNHVAAGASDGRLRCFGTFRSRTGESERLLRQLRGTGAVADAAATVMEWLRNNVKASVEVPVSERLELLEVLSKLEAMDANDTRTVRSWQRVRGAVPKVWKRAKPVRDALIGEAVKKALETFGL